MKQLCQREVESRVALIAINEEEKVFLEESERWPGFLTVPGKKIEHGVSIEDTISKLIEESSLKRDTKIPIEFIEILPARNPEQFYLKNAHMLFLEYLVRVIGTSGKGEFHKPYRVLHDKILVEEYTYQVLDHYIKFLFKNHQPK